MTKELLLIIILSLCLGFTGVWLTAEIQRNDGLQQENKKMKEWVIRTDKTIKSIVCPVPLKIKLL